MEREEIFYNRIKLIPLLKGCNYKEEINTILQYYKDLDNDYTSKPLYYKITEEYPNTVILELVDKKDKNTINI